MDRRVFIGLGAVGVLLAGYAVFFMSSDEDEIRELLDRLARAASLPEGRGNPAFFGLQLKGQLDEIFAPGGGVRAPELGEGQADTTALSGAAVRFGERYQSTSATLSGIEFTRQDPASAKVRAELTFTASEGGRPTRQVRGVTIEVVKIDGDWRVALVEALPATDGAK